MIRSIVMATSLTLCVGALQGCAGIVIAGAAGTAMVLHDRRDFSTQVDDTALEMTVTHALATNEGLKNQARLRLFAVNRKILAVGQVPSDFLKSEVDRIVRSEDGVTQFYNELEIAEPIPFSIRSHDSWLSTKVRTALISDEEFDFTRVKIITENGRIYLMGLVTQKEADMATEITRKVSGVKEVVRVFELVTEEEKQQVPH
ncbi:BON domain-containing protein [Echinimonas agarilytica]|uniref:BON domain-containing protein n=1 Tax=Echinimonas agarilytica TaxID=1215918 RepID=A0AA41W4J4_9GAMM|nr:BON domain-containing protein [Echinimonas agarilytica]MCM2678636.1 BON domain-containing protein [Echinimonas agarilytica]